MNFPRHDSAFLTFVATIFIYACSSEAFTITTTTTSPSRSSFLSNHRVPVLGSPCVCHWCSHSLLSSKYRRDYDDDDDDDDDDDEDDDDDDDDDDYDDYDELDSASLDSFRNRMDSLFGDSSDDTTTSSSSGTTKPYDDTSPIGEDTKSIPGTLSSVDDLINFARSKQQGGDGTSGTGEEESPKEWAIPADTLEPGVVLLANPAKFCANFGNQNNKPSPALLNKFGLTLPPPVDLGPDRRADLLPVLMVVDQNSLMSNRAVLLNRRTGYLLGDLEQPSDEDGPSSSSSSSSSPSPPSSSTGTPSGATPPLLEKFCIQPLWFGGVDSTFSGIDMLHMCPAVTGAKQLTEDGLFWGGDPSQAQDAMSDPSLDRVMTGFDFKFFVQCTMWLNNQLNKEIKNDVWILAKVSKEVLFKSRDRIGTRRAKPLWTEIMELLGNEYQDLRDQLYQDK